MSTIPGLICNMGHTYCHDLIAFSLWSPPLALSIDPKTYNWRCALCIFRPSSNVLT